MRLKIRLNLGAGLPDYKEDQIVDEKDEVLAQKLIRMGAAEELPPVRVKDEPPAVKATPKPPAETKSATTKKDDKK